MKRIIGSSVVTVLAAMALQPAATLAEPLNAAKTDCSRYAANNRKLLSMAFMAPLSDS